MQIDKGWTACRPIFVAVDAEDHNIAKTNPEINNQTLLFIYRQLLKDFFMKPYAYIPGLLILSSLLTITITGHSQDTKENKDSANAAALKYVIDQQNYVFVAQSATPMSGRPRQLTGEYDLVVSKATIVSYLPYYGRAYTAPIDPTNSGIQFTSKKFEYTAEAKEKGGWNVRIKLKDQHEVSKMNLSITASGYATLQVTCPNRQPISFYGHISGPKQHH
jgi:hypothetical protein